MSVKRWTVVTANGAHIVYAPTEAAARRKIQRAGQTVTSVRPRGYKPPPPKGGTRQ